MVRSLLLTIAMLLCAGAAFAQNTNLLGNVKDGEGEPLVGASVKVLKGTDLVKGSITDYEGKFRIPLDAGYYTVEVTYTGYKTAQVSAVQVLTGKLNYMDDVTLEEGNVLDEFVVTTYVVPLIKQDETSTGNTLTSKDIAKLPTRSINAIAASTPGVSSVDGGAVNIKGSRSNATNYYIDGVRVSGSTPPVQDIEQLSIITGGLGAEYGDVTGGVISIITKGPASEYHGAVELENSNGLDPYGWLLGTANISGPILKRRTNDGKNSETILGFRLSGQYQQQKDDDPSALPSYRVKPSVRENIAAHPLFARNGTFVASAENITRDSVDVLKYRPNENRRDIDLTGKIDYKLTKDIDISITGTYKDTENKFTPGGWGYLNTDNNPTQYNQRYRGIARFRHRLGSSDPAGNKASSNKVSISNASYQLQAAFERGSGRTYDPVHKDRIFDYGYIGRFNFVEVPQAGFNDSNQVVHVGNTIDFTNFQPGYTDKNDQFRFPNQVQNTYNEFALSDEQSSSAFSTYNVRNGFFSDVYNDVWSGMYTNINQVYNSYNKSESDILIISASSGFDLKLGKSGVHNIQFGLLNEQRTERSWGMAPSTIWNLMNNTANIHFNGLNTDKVVGKFFVPGNPSGDSTDIYANAVVDIADVKFYKKIREKLGLGIDEYVNGAGLTPDQVSLDMFSARELTDAQLVDYYGYDYLGNKTPDGVVFEDFFRSVDADGVRNFPVAPLRPLYQAAFLKDKFTFNSMIFSLGLRIERFDLNTKVMRDPYSLYQIKSAKDYFATTPGQRPGTIGDDFKVYLNQQTLEPSGYRDGDQWYFADGRQANDGNQVFGSEPVTPLLADEVSGGDIFDRRFDPKTAFEDYTPQVNWLPRLAFSFPISKEANFFAHYDILVQRPPDGWQITPLDYLYFYTSGRTPVSNGNLKPERVVDYEVGFQQQLNKFSALKFSAYYREQRDMIQRRTIAYVPTITRYDTYGNVDFGTVKGFTLQYDLRRIQNAQLLLAYTLQFADGTGSDANSQRGLTTRGNLRTLFPLSFDERHNISAIFDYRFDAAGRTYTGPRIGGKDILALFGANFQINGASGKPYTAKLRPSRFGGDGTVGSINGNRLPWRINVDMRVDKTFVLTANNKKTLNLNIYLRIANLLNRKNIVGVYPVTGSPTDDGYLATGEGQSVLDGVVQQGRNLQGYLDAYSWTVQNGNNFTQPRRIYVGASFEF